MTDELRRAIAFIAGNIIAGTNGSSVYDHAAGSHFNFSGELSAERVNVVDNARSSHISGTLSSLFDYAHPSISG